MTTGHGLPLRSMPLDVEGATPAASVGWGGMSGAGVILGDGRLVGIVVGAERNHEQRRLRVVPLADVLVQSADVAEALLAVLGSRVFAEARDAPVYREILRAESLGRDGLPTLVRDAELNAFGVESVGIPHEQRFLSYVPRDHDADLRTALAKAQNEGRMLLVVGGSAAGKSRSAAEAIRALLSDHRLLCPRQTSLGRLTELHIADLSPALVWLDDVERFDERTSEKRWISSVVLESWSRARSGVRNSRRECKRPMSVTH